jgi:hypothetical protein
MDNASPNAKSRRSVSAIISASNHEQLRRENQPGGVRRLPEKTIYIST